MKRPVTLGLKRAQARHRATLASMLTKQSKPRPFESGRNMLPGMEEWLEEQRERLNQVRLVALKTERYNRRKKS